MISEKKDLFKEPLETSVPCGIKLLPNYKGMTDAVSRLARIRGGEAYFIFDEGWLMLYCVIHECDTDGEYATAVCPVTMEALCAKDDVDEIVYDTVHILISNIRNLRGEVSAKYQPKSIWFAGG